MTVATFTPPTVYDNPPVLPDKRGLEQRLFRYFPNRARYVAVFALSDGTFVQDTPTAENSNTNIPYPYNPWNPEAPYSTSYYIDFSQNPPEPTSTAVAQNPYITKVYLVPEQVSAAEATALTAAGYGDRIMYAPTMGATTINSTTSVTVNWTPSASGAVPTGFNIQSSPFGFEVSKILATATSATITGSFVKGQPYTFQVNAYSHEALSGFSLASVAVIPNP